jgi:hypothetical protein
MVRCLMQGFNVVTGTNLVLEMLSVLAGEGATWKKPRLIGGEIGGKGREEVLGVLGP